MDPEQAEVKAAGGVVRRERRRDRGRAPPALRRLVAAQGQARPGRDAGRSARCARSGRRPACAASSARSSRPTFYNDRKGRSKAVRYWLMEPVEDERVRAQRRGRRAALAAPVRGRRAADLRRTTPSSARDARCEPRPLPRPARRLGAARRRRPAARSSTARSRRWPTGCARAAWPTTAARSSTRSRPTSSSSSTRAACATLLGGEPRRRRLRAELHGADDALRGDRRARARAGRRDRLHAAGPRLQRAPVGDRGRARRRDGALRRARGGHARAAGERGRGGAVRAHELGRGHRRLQRGRHRAGPAGDRRRRPRRRRARVRRRRARHAAPPLRPRRRSAPT